MAADRRSSTPRLQRLSLDDVRASLWVFPTLTGVMALAVALALLRVRSEPELLRWIEWPGDRQSASTTLQIIAASVITVTSLALSLVVIALQLASQQFSPRLLREFARDRVIQVALSTFMATFVFSLTTLRGLDDAQPLPEVSLLLAFVLGLVSMAALVGFLAHIIRLLRVDTMMVAVHEQTRAALERFYEPYDDPPPRPDDVPGARGGRSVRATRSGFLRIIDADAVVAAAAGAGALVHVTVRPGDHIARGTPVASYRLREDRDDDDLARAVLRSLELGYERTLEQDAAFGFRQLSDIAVKALSPGINDPATAVHAVGYLADLLIVLCGSSLGPAVHADDAGVARVVVPDRDLRYYLDLACGLVRRFARREPIVLVALLRMLRDVAVATRDDAQRDEVRRQVELLLDEMAPDLIEDDEAAVRDMARRVRTALAGDVDDAYEDRSGETRST